MLRRFAVLLITLVPLSLQAQVLTSGPHRGVVQVPIGHDVYAFLRHLSVRGLIDRYSEVQLPLSEFEVSQFLESVDRSRLSSVELGLRQKYYEQIAHEPYPSVTVFGADSSEAFFKGGVFTDKQKYLYRWRDDATYSDFYANALLSAELRRRETFEPATAVLGVIGGRFYGTLSGHVGYFLEATNGQSFGDSSVTLEDPQISKNRNFTSYSKNNFDFTTAELSYNYDWFTGKLAREALAVGGSYQGDNVTLSPNVPTYDFLSLQANVGVVRYQAVVASLLGEAKHSIGFDTARNWDFGASVLIDDKFLTMHNLSFFLGEDFEMGFTDMVIFSRRFDLAYLNPFSFLKSVEHSLNDRDNGLLGMHARVRPVTGLELRGQVLMDDVQAGQIGKGWWGNKFAWQAGAMWAAPFGMNEIDLTFEWTRVEPFMYSHFNPQNTYSSTGTVLGSQIGPNAVSYWSQLHWDVTRDLLVNLDVQLIQRGENEYDSTGYLVFNAGSDFEQSIRDEIDKARETRILNGKRVNILSLSAYIQFEPIRGLQLFLRGTNKSVDYLNGVPHRPREHSKLLVSLGARAMF